MYSADNFPALSRLSSISLEEMSAVSLMNRVDIKFILTAEQLSTVLEMAAQLGYRVCEIDGQRVMGYESVYYDTAGLDMFTMHRNGKLVRQKIRTRKYKVSNQAFLEIKKKNNHRRTKKKRMAMPPQYMANFSAFDKACEFVQSRTLWNISDLSPETTTDFDRITLVNAGLTERVTIDLNLCFRNFRSGISAQLGPLVIIELKQSGLSTSLFRQMLLQCRVFPYRVSKYCIAVALTDPTARVGRYKEKIRHIEHITNNKLL